MCGATASYGFGGNDLWIIKTDSQGNMIWNKTFGGTGNERCYSMGVTDDGGYIFVVCKDIDSDSGTMEDTWIIKTDDIGNAEWKFQIEEEGIQHPSSMMITDDGGYIIAGRTGDMNDKNADGYMLKVSSFHNQRPNKPDMPVGPSKGKTGRDYTFSTNAVTDPDGDTIQLMWDWGDGNYSELLDTTEATYTWSYEDNFEVRVMAIDENGGESDWSDPLSISMPKNKPYINAPFLRFLENHPYMFPLLRQLLKL